MSRSGRAGRRGAFVTDVRAAAAVEAKSFGHERLGLRHLLLGLRAIGGPSAHALASCGVALPDLRRAVALSSSTDDGTRVRTTPPSVRAIDRREAFRMPISTDARRVLDRVAFRWEDTDLLDALLDEEDPSSEPFGAEDGVVPELLDRLDHATGRIRRHLASTRWTAAGALAGPADPPAGPAEAGTAWLGAAYTQLLTPSIEQVRALLSDPQRRPERDPSSVDVVVAGPGVERVFGPDGSTTDHAVTRAREQEVIAWRWPVSDPPRRWTKEIQIRVSAQGDNTVARLTTLVRGRPVLARIGRPFLTRIMDSRLRTHAQGVNQAAE